MHQSSLIFLVSIFALIAAVSALDIAEIQLSFDDATPRRVVAGFLTAIALLLLASSVST